VFLLKAGEPFPLTLKLKNAHGGVLCCRTIQDEFQPFWKCQFVQILRGIAIISRRNENVNYLILNSELGCRTMTARTDEN